LHVALLNTGNRPVALIRLQLQATDNERYLEPGMTAPHFSPSEARVVQPGAIEIVALTVTMARERLQPSATIRADVETRHRTYLGVSANALDDEGQVFRSVTDAGAIDAVDTRSSTRSACCGPRHHAQSGFAHCGQLRCDDTVLQWRRWP
jgi:hypothetical protein